MQRFLSCRIRRRPPDKLGGKSIFDFRRNEKAKATFKKETTGLQYRYFLPPDQKPPAYLNKELMDRYRALLSKYYLKEKPKFQ